jgi:hypothetical protein
MGNKQRRADDKRVVLQLVWVWRGLTIFQDLEFLAQAKKESKLLGSVFFPLTFTTTAQSVDGKLNTKCHYTLSRAL